MGKMNELDLAIGELERNADALLEAGQAVKRCIADLKAMFSGEEAETVKEPEKTYTLEEVRGLLASLAGKGHREDVRQLLKKHGSDTLKGLDPAEYPAVVREAQVMDDA